MAIAFDAVSTYSTTNGFTHTFSFTTAGSNRMLFVIVLTLTNTDTITGVTYAGTSMTRVAAVTNGVNTSYLFLYALPNPASGANNVVVTSSDSRDIYAEGLSYTGVKNEQPEASNTANNSNSSTISASVTTLTDNAWVMGTHRNSNSIGAPGSNTTARSDDIMDIHESSLNPISPTGSTAINVIDAGVNAAWTNLLIVVSFAPAIDIAFIPQVIII